MSEAIPVPSKFAHLVLKTSRFKEQRKFYQDLLGARIVHEAPGIVFLSYDDEHHRLAIMERPGVLPKLNNCLLYTSPSPRDRTRSRMPSSA